MINPAEMSDELLSDLRKHWRQRSREIVKLKGKEYEPYSGGASLLILHRKLELDDEILLREVERLRNFEERTGPW